MSKDRFQNRVWRCEVIAAVSCLCFGVSTATAQSPQPSEPAPPIRQPSPIGLDDLPPPTDAVDSLITSGRVTFEAGQRADSGSPRNGPSMAAETRYSVAYKYSSRSRWKIDSDHRSMVISLRLVRVEWKPEHVVWFRRRPSSQDFWSDPLVQHELDHVRISNDPRLAARFKQLLRERRVITRPIGDSDVINREFVDRLVDQYVAEVFSEVADLIAIRYRELDRVTGHGMRPLPTDSPLQQWLRPDPDDSQ